MGVITSQEMADYLYVTVVIPLKGIEVQPFELFKNPFESLSRRASLGVRIKPTSQDFSHNYERHAYERTAKLEVVFNEAYDHTVVAEYDRDKRTLVIYEDVARRKRIMPFMVKLHRLFEKTAPYYKVKMVKEAHAH